MTSPMVDAIARRVKRTYFSKSLFGSGMLFCFVVFALLVPLAPS